MKLKTLLGAGCLAAALGCGNGYGINNEDPEQADVVQTADGSYTPADAGNGSNRQVFNPELPIPDPRFPRGPFNPGNVDDPTQAYGWGVYCIRKQTQGSTHFGFLARYGISDGDGINEIGLVAYGERTKQKFMQEYPGTTEASYNNAKRNFGNPGDEDALALYVIDNDGNETEFDMKLMSCEALDKLLQAKALLNMQ